MNVLYYPVKANLVVDALSLISMGSVAILKMRRKRFCVTWIGWPDWEFDQ